MNFDKALQEILKRIGADKAAIDKIGRYATSKGFTLSAGLSDGFKAQLDRGDGKRYVYQSERFEPKSFLNWVKTIAEDTPHP